MFDGHVVTGLNGALKGFIESVKLFVGGVFEGEIVEVLDGDSRLAQFKDVNRLAEWMLRILENEVRDRDLRSWHKPC